MRVADPRQVPSTVFMYTLHPVRLAMLTEGPTAAERSSAAEHWSYSQELLAKGVIVFRWPDDRGDERWLVRDRCNSCRIRVRRTSDNGRRSRCPEWCIPRATLSVSAYADG
jgi:hypothetical protein